MLLCNPDRKSEVVGKGLILGIGGNGCVHHGKPIGEGWFRVQLAEIVLGKGNTPLYVPNLNDDPPQLELRNVKGGNPVWERHFLRQR